MALPSRRVSAEVSSSATDKGAGAAREHVFVYVCAAGAPNRVQRLCERPWEAACASQSPRATWPAE